MNFNRAICQKIQNSVRQSFILFVNYDTYMFLYRRSLRLHAEQLHFTIKFQPLNDNHQIWHTKGFTGRLHDRTDSIVDHRFQPPEFKSRFGHVWWVFHLLLPLLTLGGRSVHFAYCMHKSGCNTSNINIKLMALAVMFSSQLFRNRVFPFTLTHHVAWWSGVS